VNRRNALAGAAALAASSVVPASLAAVKVEPSPDALEFVRLVQALRPDAKIMLAALFRATPAGRDALGGRLADIVEEIGRHEGGVPRASS